MVKQTGLGTTTINNANNAYSGGTEIDVGTLAAGAAGALGSGTVVIIGAELLGTFSGSLGNALHLERNAASSPPSAGQTSHAAATALPTQQTAAFGASSSTSPTPSSVVLSGTANDTALLAAPHHG
jgi:autotransporter-associated beta strand protein